MEEIKDYICDTCSVEMSVMELGFLGSEHNSCSPFVELNDRGSSTEKKNS